MAPNIGESCSIQEEDAEEESMDDEESSIGDHGRPVLFGGRASYIQICLHRRCVISPFTLDM